MNSIIRFGAAVNKVRAANPPECLEEIRLLAEQAVEQACDITVFPYLALCSPSCGSLLDYPVVAEQCADALERLCADLDSVSGWLLVGLAAADWSGSYPAVAVIRDGELAGLLPCDGVTREGDPQTLPPDAVFACGGLRFRVLCCPPEELALRAGEAAGCDLIIVPAYAPVFAGYTDRVRTAAQAASQALGCAVAVVNGGVGDTSSPHLYQGFGGLWECGRELLWQTACFESLLCTADLDADVIHSRRREAPCPPPLLRTRPVLPKQGLLRPLDRNPFLPFQGRASYLEELFDMQVRALAGRLENTGLQRLVVGVSGGLDSTAALLVSARALDALGLPRENLVGVTMPGFGTSDRTYFNALSLLEALGCATRDISIKAAVTGHLEDIGHTGQKDTTYENAQARERTQVLLDLANSMGGLVVGTGDLSEEALGFCTFAGDQIANYNVNNCITKGVLRELVGHVARTGLLEGTEETLLDILDTPISPELLPPGEGGEIRQRTEDILGPYELHDFFLYHLLHYRFRPAKIYYYACMAFAGSVDPNLVREKLSLFLSRFCAAQFKRSCAPDSAAITEVNLNGTSFHMPSDLDPTFLLRDLEWTIPADRHPTEQMESQ